MPSNLFAEPTAQREPRCYADVVVRQGNRAVGPFSYQVPPSLCGHVQPGQLVWVPFRQTCLPAIVVALSDQRPDFATKRLDRILESRPVLTEAQLALGRWMADYYLCSLGEALFAMLPPGMLHRTRTMVSVTEAGRKRSLEGLTPLSQQVIEALRGAEGGLTDRALARALGRRSLSRVLERLSRRGWLTLRTVVEDPEAHPYFEPFLVLTAAQEDVDALKERLWAGRRDSAPARVLDALARSRGGTRDLSGLYAELKVNRSSLRGLEEGGLVRLEQERRTLHLTASDERVAAFFAESGQRAQVQAALLHQLVQAERELDLDQVQVSWQVRQALQEKGLLREVKRPARALLTVLPEEAQERAAALRRTRADECQAGLLEVLSRSKERALPLSALYKMVGAAARADVNALVDAGVAQLEDRQSWRDPLAEQEVDPETPPTLTGQQGQVWREIYDAFGKEGRRVFLLHGVTGSGKTEIYLRALGRALRDNRQAIVLVPEISLTPQTVRRFSARFPGRVTVLHSGLSMGERYDQWRRVREGLVDVVVGPRSALFAPLPRLGLIIVDEEHDASYMQDDWPPRYHAREAALTLARITGSLVILGGATPSLESYAQALRGQFRLLELPDRIRTRRGPGGKVQALVDSSMPRVQIVDMRDELRAGNRSMFSRALQQSLRETLRAGEQVILFLNRRGAATFVLCRECGYVARCTRCEVPYVYHADLERLVCHRCGRQIPPPQACPECGGRSIRQFGAGTERVVAEVQRLFPSVQVLRWDSDVARDQQSHDELLNSFIRQEASVMVGTQLVAKGLDLPLVTLVGVVSADTALHLPDFRAAERTFQLVTQVIGRAGRREEHGRAVIQTYHPDHYAIRAAALQDYKAFFRQEMAFRKRQGYPPLRQLALLAHTHAQELRCREEAFHLGRVLQERARAVPNARVLGPAPAFVHKQRGRFRWQLLLLAEDVHPLLDGLELSAGWTVIVDPVSLLV